ncbi:MAG: hypothetical protein KatS3mg131_1815 [Candidatus Tectimicrobiota bacterium]|nr:MAG: hypothetical protein KatS3mg131_1815 [Candidatus Tectomicrobia bacterium]
MALERLRALAALDPRLRPWCDELQTSYYTVEELSQHLRQYRERLDADPARLQAVEERLATLARLKRKYGATLADILAYREAIERELQEWEHREERLEALTAALEQQRRTLKSLAVTVSDKRRQAALRLQQAVQQVLQELNMAGATFHIACTLRRHPQGPFAVGSERVGLTAEGIDEVTYLFAPNPGQPPRPLARIASGGELSRVMLALKSLLAQEDQIPTLVFDEVDAGIGGQTANIVGEKLHRLARSHQILCITHLPQIASHADHHYHVAKQSDGERTTIRVRPLDFAARVEEIARMSGGTPITEATRKHAEELLTRHP